MILRIVVYLLIIDVLIPACHATVLFTVDPKKNKKVNVKYNLIPRSPVRILYDPKQKSGLDSTDRISRMGSARSNSKMGSPNDYVMGSPQPNSKMGSFNKYVMGSSGLNSKMGSPYNSRNGRTNYMMNIP